MNEEDSRDVLDELIDRYGDPPKAVAGLINVALTRNSAAKMGIREIAQRGENLYFYITDCGPQQIAKLCKLYGNRIKFNDSEKPYFVIKLDKKEKTPDLMREAVMAFRI